MRANEKRYVIVYDIANDGNRTRLANKLLDLGDRVQKSVFEVSATPAELELLLRRIRHCIRDGDNLRVYGLCANCSTPVCAIGRSPEAVERMIVI